VPRLLRPAALLIAVVTAAAIPSGASSRAGDGSDGTDGYEGRVALVRLRWRADGGFTRRGGFSAAWNHDYPRAEQHLSMIVKELTLVDIWEWSGEGLFPFDASNEAYKLGVNYVIYGLTH
jgi:hypothetical protein